MNDSDKILYNQWLSTNDHMRSFREWKRKELGKIKTSSPYKITQKSQSKTFPPPNQAYLTDPEFSRWCAERDAKGLDY